jgi:hypothetical protein
MNKTEAAYSKVLDALVVAGDVHRYWFESVSFSIGTDCRYVPDFLVQLTSGELEVHEVKGFMREDARVKLRAFAAMYPFRLYVVRRKGLAFDREEIPRW